MITAILVLLGTPSFTVGGNAEAAPATSSQQTVSIWLQATDSCTIALPNITFTVSGPGVLPNTEMTTGGSGPQTIPSYRAAPRGQRHCPWDRRSCVGFSTGCASVRLNVPATGTATFTIIPKAISGKHYLSGIVLLPPKPISRNYSYVWCEGGSDCRYGPQIATVQVTSSGSVSAMTQNINPDGFKDPPWLSTGARNHPLMFSFFGASAPHDFSMTCGNDGTHLLRDHMTGTPGWHHCDSGR